MPGQPGIYVEIFLSAPIDEVWRVTQQPLEHQRWDLRFTEIEYLPRSDEGEPQRFLYATRIGFGLAIRGTGESVGERVTESGEATSSLRFASDDPKSLIRTGSGYWRYVPLAEGVRFFTWYDYATRFGLLGRMADCSLFRPLMGWATAWSFDRLRLWLEDGQTPEASLAWATVYALARTTVALVWLWHGLVPKVIARDAAERLMLQQAGLPASLMAPVGFAEIAFGIVVLFAWRRRWPLVATVAAMLLALLAVGLRSPQFVLAAFNPVTLNLSVIALCVVAWIAMRFVPTARRCLRVQPKETA
ncbi:MAG TPA: DoxX-like family protein [Acidobacteriaceae bacterium]|nr:DoxX-like family protein [Acidobacteriaceae bacterium]